MLLFIFFYAISVLYSAVGNTIKDLRKQRGISQEKLAEAIDSHQVYISEIERGLKMPSLPILYEIAKCFVPVFSLCRAAVRRQTAVVR